MHLQIPMMALWDNPQKGPLISMLISQQAVQSGQGEHARPARNLGMSYRSNATRHERLFDAWVSR